MIPYLRRLIRLLWLIQAGIGGIAGLAIGDACISTRCTRLEPPSRGTLMRVEVFVLGIRVSDETGIVASPEDGPVSEPGAITLTQEAWVYGLPLLGGVATAFGAVRITRLLLRLSAELADPQSADQNVTQGSPNE